MNSFFIDLLEKKPFLSKFSNCSKCVRKDSQIATKHNSFKQNKPFSMPLGIALAQILKD